MKRTDDVDAREVIDMINAEDKRKNPRLIMSTLLAHLDAVVDRIDSRSATRPRERDLAGSTLALFENEIAPLIRTLREVRQSGERTTASRTGGLPSFCPICHDGYEVSGYKGDVVLVQSVYSCGHRIWLNDVDDFEPQLFYDSDEVINVGQLARISAAPQRHSFQPTRLCVVNPWRWIVRSIWIGNREFQLNQSEVSYALEHVDRALVGMIVQLDVECTNGRLDIPRPSWADLGDNAYLPGNTAPQRFVATLCGTPI